MPTKKSTFSLRIAGVSDPGLVRTGNEDAMAFDAEAGLLVLADGMGGHNAGEIASGMATAFIKSELLAWRARAGRLAQTSELEAAMLACITAANSAIFNMSRTNAAYAGMGTTLVVAVLHRESLILAHVGDSRCYRLREGQLQQITKDHSIHQEQIDSGLLTAEQARTAPGQNVVTRAVGIDESVQVEINRHAVMPDDVYLLCSDGLSDLVDDAAIAAILTSAEVLDEQCRQLVAAANNHGGRDNISVLLCRVGSTRGLRDLIATTHRTIKSLWPA